MNRPNRHRTVLFAVLAVLLIMAPSLFAEEGAHRDVYKFFQAYTIIRVWAAFLFGLTGFLLLIKSWLTRTVRLLFLGLTLFVFGILSFLPLGEFASGMSMHPSPMCMLEKPFMFLQGGRGIPIFFFGILSTVVLLNLIGNKLFCGWACPAGALQELIHRIPLPKFKIPFRVSNSIRIGFFALFLIVLFASGTSLFRYVNAFEFFHFTWEMGGLLVIIAVSIASLFVFRPFCYLLCPMGLFSWLFEHVALFRVYKTQGECKGCAICVEKSPCPGVGAIAAGKRSRPDCFACGACIDVCPNGNLKFTIKK